jgi:hypothetical protein
MFVTSNWEDYNDYDVTPQFLLFLSIHRRCLGSKEIRNRDTF